jgi:hypothetical protein
MKQLLGLLIIMAVAYLGASLDKNLMRYKHDLFLVNHWKNHYQLKQMSHSDLLCRDSNGRLCVCGSCR